jgi:hypothetical protein
MKQSAWAEVTEVYMAYGLQCNPGRVRPTETSRTWILVRPPSASQVRVPLEKLDISNAIPSLQRCAKADG